MKNLHRRFLDASPRAAGQILDTLSSNNDALWPFERWPRMAFDRGLEVGARGGHGPIRYFVEEYTPGTSVIFRFTAPKGFLGTHRFWVEAEGEGCEIRHIIDMRLSGSALLTWPFVFRPLHDALLEDALDKGQAALAGTAWPPRRLPLWVRLLRALLARRRRGKE